MLIRTAKYISQSLSPVTAAGQLSLATDLSRDPVYLEGRIKNGPDFSAAMLILGKVVRASMRQGPKDHTAYQEWVQSQYLEEMGEVQAQRILRLPKLVEREARLREQIKEISKDVREASEKLNDWRSIQKFYNWLYDHNRDAWIVIDPIVSVQPDATFFEGFSIDESVYARVKLPADQVDSSSNVLSGTTNIDFGLGLEKEFARIRTYRDLNLKVGSSSVAIETEIGTAVEKKIELPETWVAGLVEVQSALAMTSVQLDVSPTFVAEIISRLEEEREKHGPRSLRFQLRPGEPVAVLIEPWGDVISDPHSCFRGAVEREIRVWGRRRLLLLKDILPDATAVQIGLIDSGMPTFWTVHLAEITLQLGLSGWTNLDWASRARFAAFLPSNEISDNQLTRTAALLKSHVTLSASTLASELGYPIKEASTALRQLCAAGKAMYDPELGAYRWRELFPELDREMLAESGLEERRGLELYRANAVSIDRREENDLTQSIAATVQDSSPQSVNLEIDQDGRVVYAKCTCSHFRFHKLREGPCRHMVAAAVQK